MGKYYVKFGLSENFNAGSKAMKDIMHLLESRGYRAVPALPVKCSKLLKLLDVPLLWLTLLFRVGRKGIVVYFVPSNVWRIRFMRFWGKIIGFRLVCFINDVEFMRMERTGQQVAGELEGITSADVIMVPNDRSAGCLKAEYGVCVPMIGVGAWDYLVGPAFAPLEEERHRTADGAVAFAGNLDKSPFINDLDRVDLDFRIWGSGREPGKVANVEFMGTEYPEPLVAKVGSCAWGLVWDGDSIGTCSGRMGSYLRFNNSHKAGLYLAAGIPLIVWKESGLASLVESGSVGICVSSLAEAAGIIHAMPEETYGKYRESARHVSEDKITKGRFFLHALERVEEEIARQRRKGRS